MVRPQRLLLLAGMAAAAVAVVRHGRRAARGHQVPGGMLIGDGFVDDTLSRLLLSSLLKGIAGDIAAVAPAGARVLEVGCGPGHLSIRLVRATPRLAVGAAMRRASLGPSSTQSSEPSAVSEIPCRSCRGSMASSVRDLPLQGRVRSRGRMPT
jgi:hypothetical protein